MIRITRTTTDGATRVVHYVARQPSWVARLAFTAGLIVLTAIVLIVVIPVTIVMLVVFFIASIIASARRAIFSPRSPDAGRRNVRVIKRDH
jgi:cell division protein FtsX